MLFYLLRHAEAESDNAEDSLRLLTKHGNDQADRVANFMKSKKFSPNVILTSPVIRARATAQIVAKKLGENKLLEVSWLSCGMNASHALNKLQPYHVFPSVMLVGHEPDLQNLISMMIGDQGKVSVHIGKASLLGIEMQRIAPSEGVLKFLLPVKLL